MDLFTINEALRLAAESVLVADHGEICRLEITRYDGEHCQEVTIRRTRLGAMVRQSDLLPEPAPVEPLAMTPRDCRPILPEPVEPEPLPFDPADDPEARALAAWTPVWPSPGQSSFPCSFPGCSAITKSLTGLISHTQKHGPDARQKLLEARAVEPLPEPEPEPRPRRMPCVVCERQYTEDAMLDHVARNHADKMLKCERCGRAWLPNFSAAYKLHCKTCAGPAQPPKPAPERLTPEEAQMQRAIRLMAENDQAALSVAREQCAWCDDGPCQSPTTHDRRRREAIQATKKAA